MNVPGIPKEGGGVRTHGLVAKVRPDDIHAIDDFFLRPTLRLILLSSEVSLSLSKCSKWGFALRVRDSVASGHPFIGLGLTSVPPAEGSLSFSSDALQKKIQGKTVMSISPPVQSDDEMEARVS